MNNSKHIVNHNTHLLINFDENAKRYAFSNYIIDPNKFRFKTVIRVLALVYRFIRNCKEKRHLRSPVINDEELQVAMDYFFKLATLEIKKFQKATAYEKISFEKNGIYYITVVEFFQHKQSPVLQHK